jgi:hypothetical protein
MADRSLRRVKITKCKRETISLTTNEGTLPTDMSVQVHILLIDRVHSVEKNPKSVRALLHSISEKH